MYVDVTFLSITYSTIYIRIIWSRLTKATKMERDLLAACHIALVTTARQDEEGEEEEEEDGGGGREEEEEEGGGGREEEERRREGEGLGSKATF